MPNLDANNWVALIVNIYLVKVFLLCFFSPIFAPKFKDYNPIIHNIRHGKRFIWTHSEQ